MTSAKRLTPRLKTPGSSDVIGAVPKRPLAITQSRSGEMIGTTHEPEVVRWDRYRWPTASTGI